jgi:aerobic-type carbon monoxide dehydrogenase small subunit (CoxS/CutS family)
MVAPASTRDPVLARGGGGIAGAVGDQAAALEVPTPPNAPLLDITLEVNGTIRRLSVDPRVSLLDALTDYLGLTGTKKACNQGACGACTVLLDGKRIDACLTLAVMHSGARITTIEGLASGAKLHPLQAAFIKYDAFQCGYCTPGQIVSDERQSARSRTGKMTDINAPHVMLCALSGGADEYLKAPDRFARSDGDKLEGTLRKPLPSLCAKSSRSRSPKGRSMRLVCYKGSRGVKIMAVKLDRSGLDRGAARVPLRSAR